MLISTFESYLLGIFTIGDLCEIFMGFSFLRLLFLFISSVESSRGDYSCESYEFIIDT